MIDSPVSVVIPWSNRRELELTLPKNLEVLRPLVHEIIVVNCGGDNGTLSAILSRIVPSSAPIRSVHLPDAAFNKCLALNLGTFVAAGNSLLFLDADLILTDDIVTPGLRLLDECFVTNTIAWETQPRSSAEWQAIFKGHLQRVITTHNIELVWKTGGSTVIEGIRLLEPGNGRIIPGVILVAKDHLMRIDGWDSRFTTWGFEDLDLQIRLQYTLGLKRAQMGTAYHVSHGNEKRALYGSTPAASNQANLIAACQRYSERKFTGTYLSRCRGLERSDCHSIAALYGCGGLVTFPSFMVYRVRSR